MDDLIAESAGRLFADWSARAITALPVEVERGTVSLIPDLWRQVEEQGFPLSLLTEAEGGFGLPPEDGLRLIDLAAEAGISLPLGETMMANWLLARAGLTPAEGVASFGLTGRRIAWAQAAAHLVLVDERGRLALVRPAEHRVEPHRNILTEPRDTLHLEAEVEWHPLPFDLRTVEALGALLRALSMAGSLRKVLKLCLDHAGQREQFGKPLGKFQVLQHNLAQMASHTAAANAAARGAARAFAAFAAGRASEQDFTLHAASAKIRTGEAAGLCAGWAHQLHGAIGYSHEYPLHVWTRRLWSDRDEWGAEASWAERLGEYMLAQPDLWPALTDLGEVVA